MKQTNLNSFFKKKVESETQEEEEPSTSTSTKNKPGPSKVKNGKSDETEKRKAEVESKPEKKVKLDKGAKDKDKLEKSVLKEESKVKVKKGTAGGKKESTASAKNKAAQKQEEEASPSSSEPEDSISSSTESEHDQEAQPEESPEPEAQPKKTFKRIMVDTSSSGSGSDSDVENSGSAMQEENPPPGPKSNPKKPSPKSKPSPKKRAKKSKGMSVWSLTTPVKVTVVRRDPVPDPDDEDKAEPSDDPSVSNLDDNANADPSPKKATPKLGYTPAPASATATKGWNNDYKPGKANYHPIDDATWARGTKVPYLALAKTLEAIEATSSRLKNIEILANYFRSVIVLTPEDLATSVYLCLNQLAPAYEGLELGIAETNIMKAIAQATGRSLDRIKADAQTQGDLGLVAETSRSSQKTLFQPSPLTVEGVFHKLTDIAKMSGQASQAKKISMITSMLVACKFSEARYLTRSLAGKLRIGLAEQSLLQAIAQACFLTPPDQDVSQWPPKILNAGKKLSAESLKAKIDEEAYRLKSCYCECPNYDKVVKVLLEGGMSALSTQCKLTPGIPPRPMLAQPTKGVADVFERFEGKKFTCEYKYDGERAQIHLLEDGSIHIYSRNQENNTSKYPDIITRFQSCLKGNVKSCIIDSEAVAWDLEKETILPFQVLSTRKRKDANEAEIKVQVILFAFDLLYFNGQPLIHEPLSKRRQILQENFQVIKGEFGFATSLDTDSMEEVQEFLDVSIKGNCEGLMVKTLDVNASYELAKRSQKWLKLKKDYLDSGGDSLDLVVIGGFLGKGKRTGTYGGFLLACYDEDNEEYQTICKLGTGFSDEQLTTHTEALKPHIIKGPKSYYRFHNQLTPDHWFDAVQVWEVKCADLSLSPVHLAAQGIADPERGISLRFPRFLRIREDKNVDQATSAEQVAQMYRNQDQVKNSNSKSSNKKEEEDDFY